MGSVLIHAHTPRARRIGDAQALSLLTSIRSTMDRVLTGQVEARPILCNQDQLRDYLHFRLAYETVEQVRVLFLNVRNFLIADELHSSGDIDSAQLSIRGVITRALELRAAAVILVHNHPSGDPTPSRADLEITRALIAAGKILGICLHDHIVVGLSGQISLRAKGLI